MKGGVQVEWCNRRIESPDGEQETRDYWRQGSETKHIQDNLGECYDQREGYEGSGAHLGDNKFRLRDMRGIGASMEVSAGRGVQRGKHMLMKGKDTYHRG